MINLPTEKDYRLIEECWYKYGEVLLAAAESYTRNCYKELQRQTNEFETLRQGIELPARIQAITEFIEFLQQTHV